MRRALGEHAPALALLAVAVLAMLWPLPLHLGGSVVRHYFDYDALLTADNLRGLARNAAAGHLGAALYDAPFYWPVPGTLAFTEPDLLPALLAAPFQPAGWALAYNLVLVAGFVVTAWASYALFLFLTGWAGTRDRPASAVLALAATFCAFRWSHVDHLNYAFAPFAPLAVLFTLRYVRFRRARDGVLLALTCLGEALTCLYLAFFLAACLPVLALGASLALRARPRAADLARLAAPLAAAALLAALALAPYARIHRAQGIVRDLGDVVTESGELQQLAMADVLQRPAGVLLPDPIRWDTANFPGALPLLLVAGLLASCAAKRRRPPLAATLALLFGLAALVIFFGPYLKLNLRPRFRMPFYWLWTSVPGFDGIRAVRRAAGLVELGLAAAAAPALALLARGRRRVPALSAALALALAESWAAPLPLRPAAPPGDPAYRWLAAHPGGGPVLELPPRTNDAQGVAARLAAREDGHPTLDGHSGFDPRYYQWHRRELLQGNLDAAFESGARYLYAVPSRPGGEAMAARLAADPRAEAIPGAPGLFRVAAAPLAAAPPPAPASPISLAGATLDPAGALALDGDLATRFTTGRPMRPGDAALLTLAAPAPLAALCLTPGPAFADFPRGVEVDREAAQEAGSGWQRAGAIPPALLDLAERPLSQPVCVPLDGVPARRYRIVQQGSSAFAWWSIAELAAYRR